MIWRDDPIPVDDEGQQMFAGSIELTNDKNDTLGSIVWFYDSGPFYAHAMDSKDTTLIRRIGPCTSLESAKQAVLDALEGRMNISDRAAYPRPVCPTR
jgi:hypothetical protein